jgi:DNA-binding CsgD family transcriptional regulator
LHGLFPHLTPKQHEVLRFVADNRTSKEIAWELRISESAVNQRIEGVRHRTGSPPRAELARAYRQYLREHRSPGDGETLPDAAAQAPSDGPGDEAPAPIGETALPAAVPAPWSAPEPAGQEVEEFATPAVGRMEPVLPGMLDGPHAGLTRFAAMVAIAAGMLLVAMAGLAVARSLSELA